MSLATVTIIGIVVLAVLTVVFLRVRRTDMIDALLEKRRSGSKLVSRADYVEGVEKIPVALSLASNTLYYENPDLEASFDLERIDEIEYAEDLATGRTLEEGSRVLRLRSHGAAFEFVMDRSETEKWRAALPPRRLGGGEARAV